METIEIRESVPGDLAAIEVLYLEAFPDEDLLPLVRELLQDASVALSLVGIIGSCGACRLHKMQRCQKQ